MWLTMDGLVRGLKEAPGLSTAARAKLWAQLLAVKPSHGSSWQLLLSRLNIPELLLLALKDAQEAAGYGMRGATALRMLHTAHAVDVMNSAPTFTMCPCFLLLLLIHNGLLPAPLLLHMAAGQMAQTAQAQQNSMSLGRSCLM